MRDYIKNVLQQHWFLLGIVLSILLAHISPHIGATGGPLVPEVTVKYIAVTIIFFNSGLSLKTQDLQKECRHLSLHAYIQCFSLVVVPVAFACIAQMIHYTSMDPWLINGFIVVGCMPPPVSSAVILTKSIGGNEAAAIFNSAFGSFLGIVVTPIWLLYFLGSSSSVPFSRIFGQLTSTVVIPIILGQMVRSGIRQHLYHWNIPFGKISSAILLLIIYTTFCDTFSHEAIEIDEMGLLSIIFLVVTSQCCMLLVTFWLSTRPRLRFSPHDVVAILFCSTHKSLTLGIPMLKVVFADDPQLSVLSMPLLVYHPTQILLGGLLVPTIRNWMHLAPNASYRRSGFLKNV